MKPAGLSDTIADRRGAFKAVRVVVLARKVTLPGIGHVTTVRRELLTPSKLGSVEPAARRKLPFRFGRQILVGPLCVGERIAKCHMHDGMMVEPVDVAVWPVGMPPVRALGEGPPLAEVPEADRICGGENVSEPA